MASKNRTSAEKFAREMTKQLDAGIGLSGAAHAHVEVDEAWLKETRDWAWTISIGGCYDEEVVKRIVQAINNVVDELDPRATAPVEAK